MLYTELFLTSGLVLLKRPVVRKLMGKKIRKTQFCYTNLNPWDFNFSLTSVSITLLFKWDHLRNTNAYIKGKKKMKTLNIILFIFLGHPVVLKRSSGVYVPSYVPLRYKPICAHRSTICAVPHVYMLHETANIMWSCWCNKSTQT